jgi:hypothetical protein
MRRHRLASDLEPEPNLSRSVAGAHDHLGEVVMIARPEHDPHLLSGLRGQSAERCEDTAREPECRGPVGHEHAELEPEVCRTRPTWPLAGAEVSGIANATNEATSSTTCRRGRRIDGHRLWAGGLPQGVGQGARRGVC